MVADMKVAGRREIGRRLRALPAAVRVPVQKAVTDGAGEIARMQRNLAPVKSGKLRDSASTSRLPGRRRRRTRSRAADGTTREFEALVTAGNAEVRYAHLVEYGTAPHEAGGQMEGARHPGTAAQPFFWPGYRLTRARVRSKVKRTITKAIKTAWGSGAGGSS